MTDEAIDREALALLPLAFDQPSEERMVWLETRCASNTALLNRVRALLGNEKPNSALFRTGAAVDELSRFIPPDRIGAYRITNTIGEGGMGAVFEGVRDQDNFQLRVAIKIIRPGILSPSLIERFERERQTLATLNHPNIARLYDGGQLEDGSPYMIMEFIEGMPITQWAQASHLSVFDRLWLFSDLCRAVSEAHQNLIVHRDISPSNVMVTSSGSLKLIDFGIAKQNYNLHGLNKTTTGTPLYKSPQLLKG